MDWSKAKNILIIAFIVTNTFLAYVLFTTGQDKNEIEIKDELVADVVKLLDKENIKVDTIVPKSTSALPTISVEYDVYNLEKILKIFLGEPQYISTKEEKVSIKKEKIYTNEHKSVKLEENNKKIIYEDNDLMTKDNNSKISKEEALEKAKEFTTNHGYDLKDAELTFHLEEKNVHKLTYTRVIDGILVEDTNMTFKISSNGIISFQRYWIKNIEKGEEAIIISSAPKALLRLLTREEYYGKVIKEIDVCYYFNIKEYKESINFNNSTGGVASPTWRFIFEDGEKAFLEEN